MKVKLIQSGPIHYVDDIVVDRFPFLLGRHPECDHQLYHPLVSRRHCQLTQAGGHLVVRDLQSKNGTATVKIGGYLAQLTPQDIAWTKAKAASEILKAGDVALFQIRSMNPAEKKVGVTLEQKPKVQGSFLAIEPKSVTAGRSMRATASKPSRNSSAILATSARRSPSVLARMRRSSN